MELGFLIKNLVFFSHAFTMSGIILSFAQSPPPITLPARKETICVFWSLIIVLQYVEKINSAQDFELL